MISFQKSMFYEMIAHAGPMAKFVLAVLLFMSILSWAVMLAKWFLFKKAGIQTKGFLEQFWRSDDLNFIFNQAKNYNKAPVSHIFQEGYLALKKKIDTGLPDDDVLYIEDIRESMRKSAYSERLRLAQGMSLLATVGNTAPFVGLFGTVWGIMRAFHDIGMTGEASLAQVAPGISEALITTAFGLAAAIPAVMGYNYFSHRLREQEVGMEAFITDLTNKIRWYFLRGKKE
ncbi:MAG: protein TolQ [Deltaproteobacteria bacterium]|nr:protein TolQ [Deltaproteobacteria bacterium]